MKIDHKKIFLKKTNKNDVINILGNPHTKSIDDENLWFYFDRKLSGGSIMNFGEMNLLENNVLVINFDKYGIVVNKEFYSKEDMKKIKYSEMKTKNPVSNKVSFLPFCKVLDKKCMEKESFNVRLLQVIKVQRYL